MISYNFNTYDMKISVEIKNEDEESRVSDISMSQFIELFGVSETENIINDINIIINDLLKSETIDLDKIVIYKTNRDAISNELIVFKNKTMITDNALNEYYNSQYPNPQ